MVERRELGLGGEGLLIYLASSPVAAVYDRR